MQTFVVDPNGYPVTWLSPGLTVRTKTYVTVDPRNGEHVLVAVLDPSEPSVPLPFAVQQEFQS